jgi:hypothetical protein
MYVYMYNLILRVINNTMIWFWFKFIIYTELIFLLRIRDAEMIYIGSETV